MNISNEKIYIFIDESYKENLLLVCCVYIHQSQTLNRIRDQVRKMRLDPVLSRIDKIHYADNSIGTRQAIAAHISRMPLSAYIAISNKQFKKKFGKDRFVYYQMLPKLLYPILQKGASRYGRKSNYFINSENLSDKHKLDMSFFDNAIKIIAANFDIECKIATKDNEPLLFLPDYFLGFIRDYFEIKNEKRRGKQTWPLDSLNLLFEKIGLILVFEGNKIVKRSARGEIVDFFVKSDTMFDETPG